MSTEKVLDVPSYLTASFIESSLRKKHPEMKVITLEVTPAAHVGENYACDVFRVHVTTNHGPVSLIVKCLDEAKFTTNETYTERERLFFSDFLSSFDTQLHPCVPLCYDGIKNGPIDALILQDMKSEGFKLHDRLQGLDLNHCKAVLKELAKLHALSIKLRIENPGEFKSKFSNFYLEKNRGNISKLFGTIFSHFSRGIRECYPFRYHCLAQVIDEFIDPIFDIMARALTFDPSQVLVLSHGDLWTSNVLFQYDEKLIGCCLLDFQAFTCSTPMLDLLYFFFTSTTKQLRDHHMENLLQFYLDQVHIDLNAMNVTPPKSIFYQSLDELKTDMKHHSFVSFISLWPLPLILANSDNTPNLETIFNATDETENISISLKHNHVLRDRFREVLDYFDDLGCFVNTKQLLIT